MTDAARGTRASSTTNNEGLFQVPYLLPGAYQVTVEVTGFEKQVLENVVVR